MFLIKLPLEKLGCLSNLCYLLGAQASSFLIHTPSPNTVSEAAKGDLPLTVHHFCDIRDDMPLHWS